MGAEFSQEVLHITAGSVERRFEDVQNKVTFHWTFAELILIGFDIFISVIFQIEFLALKHMEQISKQKLSRIDM